MRKIALGYSTRCNIKCAHCVAAEDVPDNTKMELTKAKEIIHEMAAAGVSGISFTAGEPFIYFDDLLELVSLCNVLKIYTRIVTNSYWAKTPKKADQYLSQLKQCGLCQLRLSYSRWHQHHVPRQNVLNGARSCILHGVDYFVSFVTDLSVEDDDFEQYLRDNSLKFFPEPIIYAGRAESLGRRTLCTDYQENHCSMIPYLAPDLTMYGCCDAGSHFNTTNFFKLGNLNNNSIAQLFARCESNQLYNCIRTQGITAIASFAGFKAREIVTYRKCELCKLLFDSVETLSFLENNSNGKLQSWIR